VINIVFFRAFLVNFVKKSIFWHYALALFWLFETVTRDRSTFTLINNLRNSFIALCSMISQFFFYEKIYSSAVIQILKHFLVAILPERDSQKVISVSNSLTKLIYSMWTKFMSTINSKTIPKTKLTLIFIVCYNFLGKNQAPKNVFNQQAKTSRPTYIEMYTIIYDNDFVYDKRK
jgi:hypothetical protein